MNALKVKKEGDVDPTMSEKIQESVSIYYKRVELHVLLVICYDLCNIVIFCLCIKFTVFEGDNKQ